MYRIHVLGSHMHCVSHVLCTLCLMSFGLVCLMCPIPCVPSVPYVLCVQFPVWLLHMSFCPICLVCSMGRKATRGMGHTKHMGPGHTGQGTHKTYGTKGHGTHGAMKDNSLNYFELGCLLWLYPIATASGRVSTTKILRKNY